MQLKEAEKALRRAGCSHASGDALRAMYAGLIPIGTCLQEQTKMKFYAHLQGFEKDSEISKEARRLLQNPLSACGIGLATEESA